MMRGLMGLALVAVGLGCAGLGRRAGLDKLEIESTGVARTAWVHTPSGWFDGPRPLVIAMHGGGPVGQDQALRLAAAWRPHFDADAVLAFPISDYRNEVVESSSMRFPRTWTQWDDAENVRGTDLIFVRDLIDTLAERTDIDRSKVFLTGFSSGGAFVWFASCFDPSPYAGFGVVGMPLPDSLASQCAPSIKRPVVMVHGTADSWFPATATADPWGDAATWLIENRRCGRYPVDRPRHVGEHGVHARGATHACQTVRAVDVWEVEGIGHCWPGAPGCSGVDTVPLLFDYWRRTAGFP